jgi:predicted nuclease of predicted toxin-antitoxin system
MIRLLADENLNNHIVRAILLREPPLDIVRVQDVGLGGRDDASVLEWAANEERLGVTHDTATMTRHAYDRVVAGKKMPGVVEVAVGAQLAVVLDDLLLLATASEDGEWEGQVLYIPFK